MPLEAVSVQTGGKIQGGRIRKRLIVIGLFIFFIIGIRIIVVDKWLRRWWVNHRSL